MTRGNSVSTTDNRPAVILDIGPEPGTVWIWLTDDDTVMLATGPVSDGRYEVREVA